MAFNDNKHGFCIKLFGNLTLIIRLQNSWSFLICNTINKRIIQMYIKIINFGQFSALNVFQKRFFLVHWAINEDFKKSTTEMNIKSINLKHSRKILDLYLTWVELEPRYNNPHIPTQTDKNICAIWAAEYLKNEHTLIRAL